MRNIFVAVLLLMASTVAVMAQVEGDSKRGKRAFLKCVICHSTEPNVHKTGPSLARVWGELAGAAEGFSGYSEAMKSSGIVWDQETLGELLRDPQSFVPGTLMKMPGLESAGERRDIVAYLRRLTSGNEQGSNLRNK